jgi:hypothetical protein
MSTMARGMGMTKENFHAYFKTVRADFESGNPFCCAWSGQQPMDVAGCCACI